MSKPKILIIETATPICSVGLSFGDDLVSEIVVHQKNSHDKLLAQNIKFILDSFDLKVNDLDAIAVNSGPGSFTGLRVGVSIAKSLCFGDSPKLISLNSLELIKRYANNLGNSDFDVLLHSHSKVFYRMKESSSEIDLLELDDNNYERPVAGLIPELFSKQFNIIPNLDKIDLRVALETALEKFNNQDFENPTTFEPRYHQEFVPRGR